MKPIVIVGAVFGAFLPVLLLVRKALGGSLGGTRKPLLDIVSSAGVTVVPADKWETRGRTDFHPIGIMLHHTAGPKEGDAPSLSIIIDGRPGIKGPLANLLLSRSGVVHVIASGTANHAGKGSNVVLEKIRRGERVTGDAKDNDYKDDTLANASFYGIEVENSGLSNDPYPREQIQALAKVVKSLLRAHGWDFSRVLHHRQWTQRKIDMSYRGDLQDMMGGPNAAT